MVIDRWDRRRRRRGDSGVRSDGATLAIKTREISVLLDHDDARRPYIDRVYQPTLVTTIAKLKTLKKRGENNEKN